MFETCCTCRGLVVELLYFRVDEVSGFVVYTCYRNAVVPLIDEIHKQKQFYHRFDYIKKPKLPLLILVHIHFFSTFL